MILTNIRNIFVIYVLGFLFAFHTSLPAFINSSFLNIYISDKTIGLIYTIASIITIIFLFLTPLILKRVGNFKVSLFLVFFEIVSLAGLILSKNFFLLVGFFISSLVIIPLIYLVFDIYLESYSHDFVTGKIRGAYLTLSNLAWIFSPLIVGLILTNGDYWKVYFSALIFLIPIFFIVILFFRKFKDPEYETVSVLKTIKEIRNNKNINNVLKINFLLNFFYAWMTIYTPLYLHEYSGFSWSEIGLIFSIMLIPFILTQFPLGKIADEKLGEKEILIGGFLIMSISTFSLFFIPLGSSLWFWAVFLFITRLGASSVEVMSSAYFFKMVNNSKANLISCLGISRALAYIIGPLSLSICLLLIGDKGKLFLVLGLIMLLGIWFSINLRDTK